MPLVGPRTASPLLVLVLVLAGLHFGVAAAGTYFLCVGIRGNDPLWDRCFGITTDSFRNETSLLLIAMGLGALAFACLRLSEAALREWLGPR